MIQSWLIDMIIFNTSHLKRREYWRIVTDIHVAWGGWLLQYNYIDDYSRK